MEKRINHTQSITHVLAQKVFSNTAITAQFISDILELPVREVKLLTPFAGLDDNRTSITALAQLSSHSKMRVDFKGFDEPQNLVKMKFLELDKYYKEYTQSYSKVRWIELFGNHPFTQELDSILQQAEQMRFTLEEGKA